MRHLLGAALVFMAAAGLILLLIMPPPSAPPAITGDYTPVSAGTKATGSIVFGALPVDGDTITIGATTYTWKDVVANSYEIAIPDNGPGNPGTPTDAAAALRAALTTVSLYIPAVHPTVELASGEAGTTVELQAKEAGTAGNSIVLNPSSFDVTVSDETLTGGTPAHPLPPAASADYTPTPPSAPPAIS